MQALLFSWQRMQSARLAAVGSAGAAALLGDAALEDQSVGQGVGGQLAKLALAARAHAAVAAVGAALLADEAGAGAHAAGAAAGALRLPRGLLALPALGGLLRLGLACTTRQE